jgi:hypothetical protein
MITFGGEPAQIIEAKQVNGETHVRLRYWLYGELEQDTDDFWALNGDHVGGTKAEWDAALVRLGAIAG